MPVFPLDLLKGEILRHARLFVHNRDILCKVFCRISALVFEHYYIIIKGRLYANHMSGIKASLNKHKDELLCRELAALNAMGGAEHAQRILLSGVKASLYDTKQIQG